jgi:hypothetical protein
MAIARCAPLLAPYADDKQSRVDARISAQAHRLTISAYNHTNYSMTEHQKPATKPRALDSDPLTDHIAGRYQAHADNGHARRKF